MKPRITDVKITKGTARYKMTLWQRIKNWFRNTFGKKVPFPEIK